MARGRGLIQGIYNAIAPLLVSGQTGVPRVSSASILLVDPISPITPVDLTPYHSGPARRGVIKAAAGKLFLIAGRSDVVGGGGRSYLMLFNKAAVPVNGDSPYWPAMPIPNQAGGAPFTFGFPDLTFPTGIAWAVSSTIPLLTLVAGTPYDVGANYL